MGLPLATAPLLVFLVVGPAHGEMEDREYEATETVKSARVLELRRREIEAELRETTRRETEAQAAAETARLAHVAERAARPYPVRLLEARCATVCHDHDRFAQNRHTWLGWQAAIMRMEYMNGALLDPGERGDLARHLTTVQPTDSLDTVVEYALLPLLLALPWLGRFGWRRWKTHGRNI